MTLDAGRQWQEANQRYLMAMLDVVRHDLESHLRDGSETAHPARGNPGDTRQELAQAAARLAADTSPPPVLDTLTAVFDLSPFERDLLLLCAGVELDADLARCCARVQGEAQGPRVNFNLALSALPQPHWSALTPDGPLRRWRLVELGEDSTLRLSPLRIDERVLHALAGVQQPDQKLLGMVYPAQPSGDLVPSHQKLACRIASLWSQPAAAAPSPVVQLCGEDVSVKRDVIAAACGLVGLKLNVMPVHAIPAGPAELDNLARLLEREAVLSNSALLLDCDELEDHDKVKENVVARLVDDVRGVVILAGRQRRRPAAQRPVLTLEVHKPTPLEQMEVWRAALGPLAENLNGQVEALVSQFNLNVPLIRAAGSDALGRLSLENPSGQPPTEASLTGQEAAALVWEACRSQAQPRMSDLAQRIEPSAGWEDLILPRPQLEVLEEVALQVRQRFKVYETWGFGSRSRRGLGISALFAGVSGTGKTMAAEVLARELRLDLYRIDLSSVVSKYIGETEKNLRQVFDAAEEGGAILLFDEADALFGKRGEVQDSHDRYANIEVSYLLQRMEAYRGLAILTTNMKENLDDAFMRRIRFIVQFPFPDAAERAEIWRRAFPGSTPTRGLDPDLLAQLNVAGGTVRNIALNAAFLAADDNQPVQMKHLLRAARGEYAKLDQPLTQGEVRGWV